MPDAASQAATTPPWSHPQREDRPRTSDDERRSRGPLAKGQRTTLPLLIDQFGQIRPHARIGESAHHHPRRVVVHDRCGAGPPARRQLGEILQDGDQGHVKTAERRGQLVEVVQGSDRGCLVENEQEATLATFIDETLLFLEDHVQGPAKERFVVTLLTSRTAEVQRIGGPDHRTNLRQRLAKPPGQHHRLSRSDDTVEGLGLVFEKPTQELARLTTL